MARRSEARKGPGAFGRKRPFKGERLLALAVGCVRSIGERTWRAHRIDVRGSAQRPEPATPRAAYRARPLAAVQQCKLAKVSTAPVCG